MPHEGQLWKYDPAAVIYWGKGSRVFQRSVIEIKGDENNGAVEQDEKEMTRSEKIFDVVADIVVYLLSAAILVGAFLFAFNASPTKAIFGYRYYTVLTNSMSPKYNIGDVIFVKLTDPEDIEVGDVITFNPSRDGDTYLTHRVTEKYDDYEGTGVMCFRTKGDANDSEDSFLIESERVIGTVKLGIPKLGYAVRFVQLKWYFVAAIAVMLIVFSSLLRMYVGMDDDEDEDSGALPNADAENRA